MRLIVSKCVGNCVDNCARTFAASLATLCLSAGLGLIMTPAKAGPAGFSFGVIGPVFKNGPAATMLELAIADSNQLKPAFVVATGLKSLKEACTDALYEQRKSVLNTSERPLVLSLAASDWSDCKNSHGRSAALERLTHVRDLFFGDTWSLGQHKIELTRLSSNASYRSYAENAHWEYGRIMFATINLPANNNDYRLDAGRNSEFEDRAVANRTWLKRLFALAQSKKLDGLVLFSDGDVGVVKTETMKSAAGSKHDGYLEMRRQIKALARQFSGSVMLVDVQRSASPAGAAIAWQDNLGHVNVQSNWIEIHVNAERSASGRTSVRAPLFQLKRSAAIGPAQR